MHLYVDNYARRLLRPRPGRKVTVNCAGGLPSSVEIADSAGNLGLKVGYNADHTIRLTVHHTTANGDCVPVSLAFAYAPAQTLAPIHESRQGNGASLMQGYIGICVPITSGCTELADIVDTAEVAHSALTITKDHSRALCRTVGNRSWQYVHARGGRVQAPMEFLHIAAFSSVLRILLSPVFGPNPTNVIHLYNKTMLNDGVVGLHVGDSIAAAVRICGLDNVALGKQLTLMITLCRAGQAIATIEMALLGRSHHVDVHKTIRRHSGLTITIALATAADIAVLEAKEWFLYREDASVAITPGMGIEFCLDSEYRFVKEGVWGTALKDPVIEFLTKHRVVREMQLFADGSHPLTAAGNAKLALAAVPATNKDYAKYSLDTNPIHTDPYIADIGGLPGTITHGLWTAASTRALVESIAADGRPERIRAYQTTFTGMVFPRDRLSTELFHVGMKRGRMLVKGRTSKEGGGPVMDVTAEVDQPKTAYVFTGQGAQEPGMGMALYEQSVEARGIWDRAIRHMLETYDVDLLDIVRTNPKELTVYFHGKAGERIRNNYMALSKRVPNDSYMDGVKQTPLVPGISAQSISHTFQSSTGLLDATQFTQTALILVAMAAVADMRAKGLMQRDAMFAGHSLGEYCALAALGDIFTLEGLLDITFYRGLLMQSAVPRDEQGRSEFGMAAVDPSRVAKGFGEDQLHLVVEAINAASPGLLEIVNYNVRGHQYVAAGTLTNLAVLRLVFDAISATGIPTAEAVSTVLAGPVGTEAVRGKATIPLRGIDVPFHSRQLLDGVSEFREALRTKFNCGTVSPDVLYRRYIPNLTAVPFEVSREYFEHVLELTGSPVMRRALD
ncbi:fatty acid synthase alpha subunit Lsd1, partial [Coemansia biformis]